MSRRRRVVRGLGIFLGSFVLLAILLWLVLRLWALHWVRDAVLSFESRHGSLDPQQWVRSVPPHENAARYFEATARLVDPGDRDWVALREKTGVDSSEPSLEAGLAAERLAARYRLALELWLEGGRQERCAFSEGLRDPTEKTNPLQYTNPARLQFVLARGEFERGERALAAERLRSVVAAAGCLQNEVYYLHHLVGLALERRALEEIRRALEAGWLDGSLGELRAALEGIETRSTEEYLRIEAATFRPDAWWRGSWESPTEEEKDSLHPFEVPGLGAAAAVRGAAILIDGLESPLPPQSDSQSALRPWQLDRFWARAAGQGFWNSEQLSRAQRSVRAIAVQALKLREQGLRSGAYPVTQGTPVPTPLAGEVIVVERTPDGAVQLSLPRSASAWEDLLPLLDDPRANDLDWTWTLPPAPPRR